MVDRRVAATAIRFRIVVSDDGICLRQGGLNNFMSLPETTTSARKEAAGSN